MGNSAVDYGTTGWDYHFGWGFLNAANAVAAVPHAGDVNGDGFVNIVDLLGVIATWGQCSPPPAQCPADVTGDSTVNIVDLLLVIANWGL